PRTPADQAERRGEKSEWNRSGIAHENARWWEIEQEKRQRRTAERKRGGSKHRLRGKGCSSVSAEADQRHATGKSVRAVHEVEQVGDPRDPDGQRDSECERHVRQEQPHDSEGTREMSQQPDAGGQAAPVVE